MSTQIQFNSKSEATRYYILDTLKSLEDDRYMSKKELKVAVDAKLAESNFDPVTEASFSESLKTLSNLEDTPITRNPLARGLYGYNPEKTIDLSIFKTRKRSAQVPQNKNLKFENKIISILNATKKEIYKVIESEQVPLSVLIDSDSKMLEKYQERVSSVKEAVIGIDIIIETLENKKNN